LTLLYLDTNVILACYAPEEAQHKDAKKLLNMVEKGRLAAVTSVLTLVEVVCVTSRAYDRFSEGALTLGREDVAGSFLRRVASINKLKLIPTGGEVSVNAAKRRIKLPALFALGLEIGSKTGVKTLDALHLASSTIASRIYGQKIDCFVTLDEDILKRRESISKLIESRVASPTETLK
jgi:predicted nucleic acid-binding protein